MRNRFAPALPVWASIAGIRAREWRFSKAQATADAEFAANLRAVVQKRKAERAAWQQIEMPLLMRESELPQLLRGSQEGPITSEGPQLHGLCVSAGYAEGEVVVLHEPTAIGQMKPGAILVALATDPSWSPLFTLASGVIVEVGGTLSHASIVAREYGLPALANVRNATRLLKTGDRVRLDATNGFVEVLPDLPADTTPPRPVSAVLVDGKE